MRAHIRRSCDRTTRVRALSVRSPPSPSSSFVVSGFLIRYAQLHLNTARLLLLLIVYVHLIADLLNANLYPLACRPGRV